MNVAVSKCQDGAESLFGEKSFHVLIAQYMIPSLSFVILLGCERSNSCCNRILRSWLDQSEYAANQENCTDVCQQMGFHLH